MTKRVTRRVFGAVIGAVAAGSTQYGICAQDSPNAAKTGPVEAPMERDYDPPSFVPSWKKPQINRQLVQDFVIYAHSDLEMVKKLLEREPLLLNASIDWGGGDWETALGGASVKPTLDYLQSVLPIELKPVPFLNRK